MTTSQRRLVLGGSLALAAGLMAWAYYLSLVPATHADHDHGILNLDGGGHLYVQLRDGQTRNLVGRPGKVLVVHFFSSKASGAAAELEEAFRAQESLKGDKGVEFVQIAEDPSFAALDAWLAENKLVPPSAESLVLDPTGDTTRKLNSKRPLETMIFGADGKLASQARGPFDWTSGALTKIAAAKGGETIE
jgi:hypothetical protein